MELDVAIASDSEKLSEHEIHRIESSETKANAEVQKLQAKMLEHEYERNIDEGKSEVAKLDKKIKDLRREKDTESADDFLFRSKSDELADKEASLAKMLYFLPVFSFSSPTSWCLCAYFIVFLEPNNNYFVQHRYLMQTIGFWVPV
jgi:hypothetical protein